MVEVKSLKIEYGVNITQAHVAILIRNLNGSCDFFNWTFQIECIRAENNISRVIPNVMSYQSSKDSSKSILNSFLPTSIGDNLVTLCWGSVPSTRLSISDSL